MERSFAARLGRPLPAAGLAHRLSRNLPVRLLSHRGVILALLLAGVLAGGWILVRNSPLVAVEQVQVSGVHGPDAAAIDAALIAQARHMSTLHLNVGALEEAVAPFHLVRAIHVEARFPHGLRIFVTEQLPVAVLAAAGQRTALAADGVALGPALASSSLAVFQAPSDPPAGGHVGDHQLLVALTVLGAAPRALLSLIARVYAGSHGLTVAMRNGLLVYFGDATRPHAKWDALVAVLADPTSQGATYIDVRLPERPAAGGAASSSPQSSTEVSATDPTAAALAASLGEAVSGAPATTPATTPASGTEAQQSATEAQQSGTEAQQSPAGSNQTSGGEAAAPADSGSTGAPSEESAASTTPAG